MKYIGDVDITGLPYTFGKGKMYLKDDAMLGKGRIDLLDEEYYLLRPGEWMRTKGDAQYPSQWYARTPVNAYYPKGAIADLGKHEVVQHDDGTISVSPSILVTGGGRWHGYLTRGVWSEV